MIENESEHPHIVLWLDAQEESVLWMEVVSASHTLDSLVAGYQEALSAQPHTQPSSLHLALPSQTLADAMKKTHPGPVSVRPETQEELSFYASALEEHLAEHAQDQETSYTDDGRLPASAWAVFFKAAKECYETAPWKHADDDQTLLFKAPLLGYPEGCVSVMGSLGESCGVALFASIEDYEAFADASDASSEDEQQVPLETPLSSPVLVVHFEVSQHLPKTLQEEVHSHGWALPNEDTYPTLTCLSSDLNHAQPLQTAHIVAATAALQAATQAIAHHAEMFQYASETQVQLSLSVLADKQEVSYEAVVPHPQASFAYIEDDVSDEAIGPAQPSLVQIGKPKTN
jgi:hypothetical protein